MNVRSVNDMMRIIAANLHRIDRYKYDCIVGIPRSGMLPASIIATYLQLPLADVVGYSKGIVHGRSGKAESRGKRILLVDDSCNKGRAFRKAVDILPSGTKITRLAIFGPYQVEPKSVCDMWFEIVHGPRVFAWNMWKHIRLPRWGFDLDGVLCRDNSKEENDDGPLYKSFITAAEPLFLPVRPIGHIITGRLEKYRPETEVWLSNYNIQYEAMHMVNLPSKKDRMKFMKEIGGRGVWKALVAKDLGVEMFIESCPKQAAIISREANIPVWCTFTQEFL